jgi:hypothetical protein
VAPTVTAPVAQPPSSQSAKLPPSSQHAADSKQSATHAPTSKGGWFSG